MESCRCGATFRSAIAEARHRHNFPAMCKQKKSRIDLDRKRNTLRSLDSLKARLRHLSAQWTDVDNYIADLCDQHADALDDVAEAIQESTLTKRRKKEA